MAAIHNYYRILGIKTTAGIQEINQAIAALRQKGRRWQLQRDHQHDCRDPVRAAETCCL